jgi:dienelactone hydrolase
MAGGWGFPEGFAVLERVRFLSCKLAAGVLVLTVVVLLLAPVASPGEQPERAKQIADLEKQLEELKKKLAELKKPVPTTTQTALQLRDVLTWKRIRGVALSRDGQWFAYRAGPDMGNNEVIVRQTKGDKEFKFSAGGPGFGQLTFSADSKWLAFTLSPSGPGRRGPRPAAAAPPIPTPPAKGKVALVNLATGTKEELEGARRFVFSGGSDFLALHRTPAQEGGTGGADLILRELATGKELALGNVSDFAFDKKGRWLALVIDARDQIGNGVQLRNLKTGALQVLDSGKFNYRGLAWSEKGDGFTVLKGTENKSFKDKLYSVLGFTALDSAEPKKIVFDPQSDKSFPKGMTISSQRTPYFAEDLSAIFFGIGPVKKADGAPTDPTKRTKGDIAKGKVPTDKAGKSSGPGKEKPDVVIWHWLDDRLQSEQQKQADFERNFSYLSLYRNADKKFVRLADDKLKQVTVAPHHQWAIGVDNTAYRRSGTLDGQRYADVHVIDLKTGKRRLALKRARWYFGPSPGGSHILYYQDGHFFTQELATGKNFSLTGDAPVSFIDVEDDHNVVRPPTFPVGWTKDDAAVLLTDNWDVWKFPAHGGPGVNLTLNGKKDGIRYRSRIRLDPEEKGIDLSVPVYFSIYGEWTKKAGYARLDPKSAAPVTLAFDDAFYSPLMKARDADVFVFTRETYKDYPEYRACDSSFTNPRRLTLLGSQQDRYKWCSGVQLVDYKSTKGDRLQGALLRPAGYEKGKSYPTIVYIYERLSQGLNRYHQPTIRGFDPAIYTSNGYAVLMPDIRYRVNDPGMSAVWCVLPALEAAAATGVVDAKRVGLHGHSWGGYQTSFLITQTNAFKAAAAGAPLTDLVSMYSLIYWNNGWTNQPIFESSQGRFKGGYWDNLEAFIRNSPVHHATKVKTPLLLLHNDKDGAVDWTQGIEYFNTLRRLDKQVVMLQYRGENHGLVKPANRRDYTIRMREFFDHHLLGKPAPEWLKKGVPHLELDDHLEARNKPE